MRSQMLNMILMQFIITTTANANQHYISINDFYAINHITECSISPNQEYIAYVVEKPDRSTNDYISNIWLLTTDDHHIRQLTTGGAEDRRPVWSPDSRFIAFQSDRSNITQIWLIDISAGEAWAVTDFPEGAYAPAWSPDGTCIAFLSTHESSVTNIDAAPSSASNPDVATITNLRYRSGTRYHLDSFTHIYLFNLAANSISQLTDGHFNDNSIAWSHNSQFLAFESNRFGNPHVDDNTDIFTISPANSKISRITEGHGPERYPQWSPNDKSISYLSRDKANDFSSLINLCTIEINKRVSVNLTSGFDYNISRHHWGADSKSIYFLGDVRGNTHLFKINIRTHEFKPIITGNQGIYDYLLYRQDSFYFLSSDNLTPSDLYYYTKNRSTNITKINTPLLDALSLVEPEEFFFQSNDSLNVHGWLMRPTASFDGSTYPLIVQIHGGPHWHYSNTFNFEFQLLAASGYALFYCNPRSSTSYGEAFAKLGVNDWAGKDVDDILSGLAYILTNHDDIDSTRLGVTGGSYGGYLTTWIIAHTDKFKAAVTQRSISNLISFYGTTDLQALIEHEFGPPWEVDNYQRLLTKSPIKYAHNIKTPLLILHSELDYRVPISHAEELFTILKRNDVTTQFIRFKNEGHDLSRRGKPNNRAARLSQIIDWFNQYL